MRVEQTMCCGIYEFEGFYNNTPKQVITYIIKELKDEYWSETKPISKFPPVIIFNDIIKTNKLSGAEKLAKYIKKEKLGLLVCTPIRKNYNSGNKIKCWLWTLNKKNLKAWDKKN